MMRFFDGRNASHRQSHQTIIFLDDFAVGVFHRKNTCFVRLSAGCISTVKKRVILTFGRFTTSLSVPPVAPLSHPYAIKSIFRPMGGKYMFCETASSWQIVAFVQQPATCDLTVSTAARRYTLYVRSRMQLATLRLNLIYLHRTWQ